VKSGFKCRVVAGEEVGKVQRHGDIGNEIEWLSVFGERAFGGELDLLKTVCTTSLGAKTVQCGKCETPIRSLDWTEDGKWLLIGEEGLNDGSGQRQDDYYLVNLATMKLSTVASAYTAFWLPGRDQIVYVTPQDLVPLPGGQRKHNVWVQQLMFFDPVNGMPTAITSGPTNNVDSSWCEGTR
jgi:hypothetical protein